jgi:hypothetical protein
VVRAMARDVSQLTARVSDLDARIGRLETR